MIKLFEKHEDEKYIIIKILFIKITLKKKLTKSDLYDFENRFNDKIEKIRYNNYLLNMSENINYNTFLKYKNINYGKEVVLIATGPTLNKYIPIKDYDYFSIKELVSKYFKIQKIYNQNSETANTKRQIIETTENNYKEAECFIIMAIKE